MTKFELLRDSLRELRLSIEAMEFDYSETKNPHTMQALSDAYAMERKILAQMEKTE